MCLNSLIDVKIDCDWSSQSKYKKQKTADHEPSKSSENDRTKARPPSGCCPSASWQRDQVSQFSEVRLKAERHAELGRRTGEVGIGTVKIPDKKKMSRMGRVSQLGGCSTRFRVAQKKKD